MDEPQEVHLEYWDEDFEIRSDEPLPDSFTPTIQATIEGLVSALLWSTPEQIDYVQRVLHRLKADDPLLAQARSAIAEERAIRNGEGPVERAGRQAMMDIWDRAPPAVALRLGEIKASLQALKADSKVRIEGERRLERSPYLELLHERLMRGEPAYRTPDPGEAPTVGDELVLEHNGERFTYGITMASPGRDGGPNELLAALSKALAAQHGNDTAGDTGGDGALHEIKLRKAAPGRPPNR